MGKVFADISVSLDGFVTGPNPGPGQGLGEGGDRLHEWAYGLKSFREPHGMEGGESNRDSEVLQEAMTRPGAGVMGRKMFDDGEGPWGDDPSIGRWGEEPPFGGPIVVMTHHAREPVALKGDTTFHFETGGIEPTIALARELAGDRDVAVSGGASVIQQALAARLLDEIQIHVVPTLLGDGVRLFERVGETPIDLELVRVVDSPTVTHLKYRVPGSPRA
jgi:dihydrofolate reductase